MYGRSRDTLYSFIKWELTFIAVVQVTADYAFFVIFFSTTLIKKTKT